MKHQCETCPTIGDCKRAFGRYWTDRSHGGVGCDSRFQYLPAGGQPSGRGSTIGTTTKQ